MKRALSVLLLAAWCAVAQAPNPNPAAVGARPRVTHTTIPASDQTQIRTAPRLPSWHELKFAPLPAIKIPNVDTVTLPNGMRVFLLEDHELPLVSGFALVRTGELLDPPAKRGLAEITGMVLRTGGTHAKSGDQIDEQLENIAASVESHISDSNGSVSFSCMKENTDEVMQVFHDLLTGPEFRQDKFELAKTQLRSAISRRNDDPNGILSREFGSIVYGRNTPFGWTVEYENLNNIHRQDLIDFYKRYYFPSNIMLGIYGDFSAPQMKEHLTKLFADWTYTQPAVPKFPEVTAKPVPGVFVATKDDVTQTFFEVGHLGGTLRDKDFAALEVAGDILGGGFSSRLFQRVRTKLGYAYSVGASWGANYDHPGLFEIFGSTQSKYTLATLKASLEELNRLRESEVTDQELKTAKDTVLNGFVFFFDRPSKTLNRLMLYDYFGYPKDFIFEYQKAVAAVTKADVLRVARQYFRPQDLTIVAVGNPKDFGQPLAELGLKVTPIELTIPEPKQEAAAPASAADVARGRELLARVRTALGGEAKLSSIKDVDYTADVEIQTPGAVMKAQQHNMFLPPWTFRQEMSLPFLKQTVYSNGKSGWIVSPQGTQPTPAPVVKQMQGESFRLLYVLVMHDQAAAVGPDTLEIRDDGQNAKLTIDPATGLPAKVSYTGGPGGANEVVETFSDWRDVNGIKVPFERTITQGGKKFANVHIKTYKFNAGLTEAQLSTKP